MGRIGVKANRPTPIATASATSPAPAPAAGPLRWSGEAEAALRSGMPRGTLRIGALESTAGTRLPPILSRYHLAYPEVRIELATGTTGALVAKVLHYHVHPA